MDNSEIQKAAPSGEVEQQRLVDVKVENEVMALNVLVSFVSQAQKRGAFSIEESAKIWECVKWFQRK